MNLAKKAFTLVEMIIGITIISILVVLVFRIYIYMSDISIRIENEKNLNNDLLFLSQTIQNYSDNGSIDFAKYTNLEDTYGITGTLHLDTLDGPVSIYSTGDCDQNTMSFSNIECFVEMEKYGQKIKLTDPNKTYIKNLYFKIYPYEDINSYNLDFDNIMHPGVGVFADVYIKNYKKNWKFNIFTKFQSFYNIRQY